MMYAHSGDQKWADYGRDWNDAIRPRATASDNDTGFQVFNAFGYALRYASAPDADTSRVLPFSAASMRTPMMLFASAT